MKKSKKFFKSGLLFLIVLVFFSSSNFYVEGSSITKQEMWDNISNDVDHWIDGIGYPIDRDIKEIVVALNIMGIKTVASCEGHFDHGYLYPWIDLEIFSTESEKFMAEIRRKDEQIETEEKSLEAKYPDLSRQAQLDRPEAECLLKLYNEHFFLSKSYEQAKMNCLASINSLLSKFYENRNVSYDRILIVSSDNGRLQSVGANNQVIRAEQEQNSKLVEYREEMKAFATFLKKKFMNSNSE